MAVIPLAIGLAQALGQFAQARKQNKEADKALSYRNPYIDTAANNARLEANSTRYPGQDTDEANIRQGTADTFSNLSRSLRSSGDLVNASSKLSGSQQRAFQDTAKQGQIFRRSAMDRYRQLLMQQAGVADANRQYSEALKGSAQQNKYNALNSVLGGAALSDFSGIGFNSNSTASAGGIAKNAAGGAGRTAIRTGAPTSTVSGVNTNFGWNFNPNVYNSFKWNPMYKTFGMDPNAYGNY